MREPLQANLNKTGRQMMHNTVRPISFFSPGFRLPCLSDVRRRMPEKSLRRKCHLWTGTRAAGRLFRPFCERETLINSPTTDHRPLQTSPVLRSRPGPAETPGPFPVGGAAGRPMLQRDWGGFEMGFQNFRNWYACPKISLHEYLFVSAGLFEFSWS